MSDTCESNPRHGEATVKVTTTDDGTGTPHPMLLCPICAPYAVREQYRRGPVVETLCGHGVWQGQCPDPSEHWTAAHVTA